MKLNRCFRQIYIYVFFQYMEQSRDIYYQVVSFNINPRLKVERRIEGRWSHVYVLGTLEFTLPIKQPTLTEIQELSSITLCEQGQ